MGLKRQFRFLVSLAVMFIALPSASLVAQAALFLEQPFGTFGLLNPTGHAAVFLQNVCAETPVRLRPCRPGEQGIVISRYKGIGGYDWIAIPLIPYLYSVQDPQQVPRKVDQDQVDRLREHYKEAVLGEWGENLARGSFFNDGWAQLVGTAYDRKTYAFRIDTTPDQDHALIAWLNDRANVSHFNLLFNNCADFDRAILSFYFPKNFGRAIFPDAGITTPKRVAYELVKYSKKHPEINLIVLEIPQVPGYRRDSRGIHGVTESLFANGYVIPILVLNPYVAGGLFADFLIRGAYRVIPKNPPAVDAHNLTPLLDPESTQAARVATSLASMPLNIPVPPSTSSATSTLKPAFMPQPDQTSFGSAGVPRPAFPLDATTSAAGGALPSDHE